MSKEPYDPMDLKALRCFEAMAKHGSLTQASIDLGISDAAVSQRIKSLEKYLGVKLYEARGGKVRLTEAGRRTKDLAMRLFDELAEFEEAIGDEESRGTVVLSADAPLSGLKFFSSVLLNPLAPSIPDGRLRVLPSGQPAPTGERIAARSRARPRSRSWPTEDCRTVRS